MSEKKLGRNDPCWCGSQKKYKHCHMEMDEQIDRFRREGHTVPTRQMIKTPEQIEGIRQSSRINIAVLDLVAQKIHEGMTTEEIDKIVYEETTRLGGIPAPLNNEGFPKSISTSDNNQDCHDNPSKKEVLRNGEKYIAALSGADYCLSGDDNGAGAVSAIREAEEALRGIRTLSDELGELYKRLESIRCEVYDLAETIRDKRAEFAFSPAELDAAEARTDQLYRLKKKYGATVEDMIAYLEQCRSELDAMETADDTLILLNGKLKKAEAVVRAAGAELTKKRKAAAQALEQRIQSELRDLDMNKVRFAIEFTEKEPAVDGCDVIRFLMSANAGEDLRPIAKIASGGELARIMLALKNVLAEQESIATLVFDEVDTGVSGRAAQKVAEKLTQVARHKQVLCVTHLPQLAAMADTHFSVEKGESGGRTFTRVIQLDREARKAELARITGGSQVTPTLLESAGELLDQADAYRKQHFV